MFHTEFLILLLITQVSSIHAYKHCHFPCLALSIHCLAMKHWKTADTQPSIHPPYLIPSQQDKPSTPTHAAAHTQGINFIYLPPVLVKESDMQKK